MRCSKTRCKEREVSSDASIKAKRDTRLNMRDRIEMLNKRDRIERFLYWLKRMDYLSNELGGAAHLVESAEDGLMLGKPMFSSPRSSY